MENHTFACKYFPGISFAQLYKITEELFLISSNSLERQTIDALCNQISFIKACTCKFVILCKFIHV